MLNIYKDHAASLTWKMQEKSKDTKRFSHKP